MLYLCKLSCFCFGKFVLRKIGGWYTIDGELPLKMESICLQDVVRANATSKPTEQPHEVQTSGRGVMMIVDLDLTNIFGALIESPCNYKHGYS